ncbi:hypothetical protein [Crocosphaera chwakensis]|uniref:Signal Transduction Histidine Kinase (STHK), LytS n=1 Tax=Crocosphaera chwakensis CCY0110 TaxID=391612 RepID=A3IPN4_9CHRO|nr:hypothetical protein [Crocosphaera chwakensis]EAZ91524.1 Signal Transduction Histidine Kinase (STHK), LytS [Crocosphaera chwakensis CCY0110]
MIQQKKVIREEHTNIVNQTDTRYKRAVGVYKNREDLETVLKAIKDSGYDMNRVSLITRDIDEIEGAKEVTEKHGNEAKEGAAAGATSGTVLGAVGGFLVGVGVLSIPGIGPLLAAGVEIPALASTAAGAGIGAATGGIIGALVGLGIPEEKAKVYEDRIKAGDHLIMVSGTDEQLEQVTSIMHDHPVEEFDIYAAQDLDATTGASKTERVEAVEPNSEVATTETKHKEIHSDADVVIVDKRNERNKVQ